jgi:hypothetical protein
MRKAVFFFVLSLSLFSQTLEPPVGGEISSDFGPRNLGDYNWHEGIDYSVGEGTEVQAVEGGEILEINYQAHQPNRASGGWHIRIRGELATWSYLHLFSDDANPASGNWEAVSDTLIDPNTGQPNPPNPVYIFINWEDRENRIANNVLVEYDYRGRHIRHNGDYIMDEHGDTMSTSGSVADRAPIGPSGNSGNVPYHLDIRCSSPSASVDAYDLNPLYHIMHDPPNYTLNIVSPAVDKTFYHLPGEPEDQQEKERIQVRINSITGKDLDRGYVYFFNRDSARVFNDAHRYAMICYGGLPQNPDSTDADTTVPFPSGINYDNESCRGLETRTGIDPQGDVPSIDDFWYIGGFSQDTFHFNSKLNKAETGDAILNKWANLDSKVAEFKDGWTDMVISAHSIRDSIFTTERRILLDNYVPYVYDVFVTRGNEVVYNAMWLLNSIEDSLEFNEKISKNISPGDELKFKIYFSEMMDTTTIEIKLKKDNNELKIEENRKWIDKMTWEGSVTIPEDDENWKEGKAVINIRCRDLAGHLPDKSPGSIASRDESGEWQRYNEGIDINHELYIGEAPIVISTDPPENAQDVPVDKDTVLIVFSKSMDQNIPEEAVSIISEKGDSISFDSSWKDTITLVISPSDTFDYCMEYTCTIKDTIMSKDSVKLDGNTDIDGKPGGAHIFIFTTEPPDIKLIFNPEVANVEEGHPLNADFITNGSKLKKEFNCNIDFNADNSGGWAVTEISEPSFFLPPGGTHPDNFTVRNSGATAPLRVTSWLPIKCDIIYSEGFYWSAQGHQYDHPDENQSPGKMEYPTPWLTRTQPASSTISSDSLPTDLPDIGILLSGWADGFGHIKRLTANGLRLTAKV